MAKEKIRLECYTALKHGKNTIFFRKHKTSFFMSFALFSKHYLRQTDEYFFNVFRHEFCGQKSKIGDDRTLSFAL